MAHQVAWTKLILEEFISEGMLTEAEEMIMRTRCAGWSRTEQAMKLGMSLATVDRIIARLKIKYDKVAAYDPVLPERKYSAEEAWMDTH